MAFTIHFHPPKDSFRKVVRSIYERLVTLGWENTEAWLYRGRKNKYSLKTPGDLDFVLRFLDTPRKWRAFEKYARMEFRKEEHRFFMFVGAEAQFEIKTGVHEDFFDQGLGVDELKKLFSEMYLPDGTKVWGDGPSEIYGDEKTWRFKGDKLWEAYFFIDQVKTSRWSRIVSCFPELAKNELARIGDKHIVAMSESPDIEEEGRVRVFPSKKKKRVGLPK